MPRFYLVYLTDYIDPADLVGPFDSRGQALAHYRQALIDSGADIGETEDAESLYLDDDAVRLAKLA